MKFSHCLDCDALITWEGCCFFCEAARIVAYEAYQADQRRTEAIARFDATQRISDSEAAQIRANLPPALIEERLRLPAMALKFLKPPLREAAGDLPKLATAVQTLRGMLGRADAAAEARLLELISDGVKAALRFTFAEFKGPQ